MNLLVCLLLTVAAVAQAVALSDPRYEPNRREESFRPAVGVPATNRTIFVMISLPCMGLLSFILGTRVGRIKRSILVKRNFISLLVVVIYTLVFIFIIISAVFVAGQALTTLKLCRAGTWVCLILYTFTKGAVFLFLVERIRIVRAPFVQRKHDKIYLACLAMVIVLFGPVVIHSYTNPVINMGPSKRRCYFGIRGTASIPILAVNMFIDLVLTGVFFYLLRPVVTSSSEPSILLALKSQCDRMEPLMPMNTNETNVQRNIRTLLWKSIIGSLLIEIPMMANMIQFVITKGEELGTICLILCVVEVVWDTLVIHWLAFGVSAQAANDLEHSVAAYRPLQTPAPSTPSSIRALRSRDGVYGEELRAGPGVEEPKEAHVRIKEPS
ncbi:hypothetical protein IQ06DRAFT_278347 [Phaeosphaeriaceae sp. SRC1lsM3a]|nr:hypothetical protein IQ06DRAFT_278347 [Stagonospora sp. SRC1lsM3a]